MAGILDRYGIKEVADVTFYKIDDNGYPQNPVLYLDTLKVSTIEQTADEATANGGKGNPPLVIWDYNKDITVTLEDALFSAKSLAIMFGDGTLKDFKSGEALIMKTEVFTADDTTLPSEGTNNSGWKANYTGPDGKLYRKKNPKFFDVNGDKVTDNLTSGEKYFCSFDLAVTGKVIDVSANTFPGTYYVTGDTYARSDITGDDEFFQFIIPKAKVQSENTITLEADGDPSTFNMSLHVMRPEDGVMMKLVKYSADGGSSVDADNTTNVYHNHYLDDRNTSAIAAARANTYVIKKEPYIVEDGVTGSGTVTVPTTGLKVSKYGADGTTLTPVTTLILDPATVTSANNGDVEFAIYDGETNTELTFVAKVNITNE